MSKKTVRYKAIGNLPKLTNQQKAELGDLVIMSDADIDYRDIPLLSDGFWQKAVHNPRSTSPQNNLLRCVLIPMLALSHYAMPGTPSKSPVLIYRALLAPCVVFSCPLLWFFNFIRKSIDLDLRKPCDTPMIRKLYREREPLRWEIIEKETIDEIIFALPTVVID